jgi:mRNA-degrading endonuclease RelE of RelBE toxin-antitoxin system
MSWKLVWTRPALKDLKKIGQQEARSVREKVTRFSDTGHGDIKKLTDIDPPEWRQRVGDWRVFMSPEMKLRELRVTRVRKRDEAYDR